MISERAAFRIALALFLMLLAYFVWNDTVTTPPATSQHADPGNPVALFHSTGIKECEYDAVYKFEGARAVLLDPDDFARAREFLIESHGMEASAILFTYSPVATEEMPGQPALIPLKRSGATFCALGVVGSYSVPLFLSLEEKYQDQIQ